MKILSVLTYYRPHWTGLTRHAVWLAEGLAARGHAVTVLTTRHARGLPRRERLDGVDVVRLLPALRVSRGMLAPGFPAACARLVSKADVVQIHTPLPEAPLVAALCRLLRRPLLMTHHGDVVMPAGALNHAVEVAARLLLSATARSADAVTAYSLDYAERSRLLRPLGGKVLPVAPPMSIPRPDRLAAERWKGELGLSGSKIVGFAGRWVEEKGFDVLLQALPRLLELEPEAVLVFAGEPNVVYERFFDSCRPLVEAAGDRLRILGLVEGRQRMADFYAMCDVFALPSRSDMMALVQVEAMACGVPVVASDIPGARVVVRETGSGLLVPPESPGELAEALAEVLASPDRFLPDPAAVRARWSLEASVARNEEVLARLAGRRDDAADERTVG